MSGHWGMFQMPSAAIMERAARVRLLALDVDGVLTDGHIYMGQGGELMKSFHIQDGKGISMLLEAGIEVAIITARKSEIVEQRAAELRLRHVLQGRKDKAPALQELAQSCGVELDRIAYAGDDLVDVPLLCQVGLAVTVANAHPWVQKHAHWQTQRSGGQGAVRELCDLILAAQGLLNPMLESYVPQ